MSSVTRTWPSHPIPAPIPSFKLFGIELIIHARIGVKDIIKNKRYDELGELSGDQVKEKLQDELTQMDQEIPVVQVDESNLSSSIDLKNKEKKIEQLQGRYLLDTSYSGVYRESELVFKIVRGKLTGWLVTPSGVSLSLNNIKPLFNRYGAFSLQWNVITDKANKKKIQFKADVHDNELEGAISDQGEWITFSANKIFDSSIK